MSFLSPHYDDIALSCGGTAAVIAAAGKAADIALIFGDYPDPAIPLTVFAAEMHQKWGFDAREVIDARRREESDASVVLGTTDHYLPFLDAIYRGERYLNDDDLFGVPRSDEAQLAAQIVSSIGLDDDELNSIRFYAPLAIGDHVDHQHAFAAGPFSPTRGYDVFFYEDLPYALISGKARGSIDPFWAMQSK